MSLRLLCLTSVLLAATMSAYGQSGPFPSVKGGPAPEPATPIIQPWQEPPCMADFVRLRAETEKRSQALQAASKRRAPPAEACRLIENFLKADQEMLTFVEANSKSCGIPPNVSTGIHKQHEGVKGLRGRVCEAASREPLQRIKPDFKIWDDPPTCRSADCLGVSSIVENAATVVLPEDRA